MWYLELDMTLWTEKLPSSESIAEFISLIILTESGLLKLFNTWMLLYDFWWFKVIV